MCCSANSLFVYSCGMAGGPNTHDNRDDDRRDGDGESVRDQGDPSGAGSVDRWR
jgi:hypothetical protein